MTNKNTLKFKAVSWNVERGTYSNPRTTHHALRIILLTILLLTLFTSPLHAQAPDTTPSVSGGRLLWIENCTPCHGPSGQGDGPTAQAEIETPLPDFSNPEMARQLVPVANFETIKNGRIDNLMPPWGNRFEDPQMWDLAANVWRLSTTAENIAAGEAIYTEQCTACHGLDGSGNGPEASTEALATMLNFTDLSAMTQRSQVDLFDGYALAHADLALPEDEVWQSLDYIRTFSFAVPQRNGTVVGQVINGTSNQPQEDLEIILHTIQGNTKVETLTNQADSDGTYTFTNLSTDHATTYVVEGRYQEVSYFSQPNIFIPDELKLTLDLEVFEATTDSSTVTLVQLNNLISFSPNGLAIMQMMLLNNNSNMTYVGDNGQTFAFSLPAEAVDITFQNASEGRITETAEGFVDSQAVFPGENGSSIVVIYNIPYNGDSLSFNQPIPADVASLNVLMQNREIEFTSDQLQFQENREFEGNEFAVYTGAGLAQGDTLTLNITGLDNLEFEVAPVAPGMPTSVVPEAMVDQQMLSWLTLGLTGVALLAVLLVYPRYRTKPAPQPKVAPPQEKLLLLLAKLDDMFEAGELAEPVYRQARAGYKQDLAQILAHD